MVDTQDLKSCAFCERAGSSPAPGTTKNQFLARGLSVKLFKTTF